MNLEIIDEPTNNKDEINSDEIKPTIEYASLSDRIKANLINGLMIIGLLFGFSEITDSTLLLSAQTKKIIYICIFGLYDPLFTAFFGGTIGHLISGLSVKQENNITKNVILPLTFIRFGIKLLLGWISLLTIGANNKSKAIHDLVVKSIVIKTNNSNA